MHYSKRRSNKRKLSWIICVQCLAICAPILHAEDIKPAKKYEYNWASLKSHPIPKWFDDAKFGIFIHWGPYSVLGYRKGGRGYAEHTPKEIYRNPEHYYKFMKETFGAHPPQFGYKDVILLFKAEKWDPDRWAELFHQAGARYVVLTAEHHDGYAMWDSDITQWCATKIGPKRDLVGELAKAVRKKGMKYVPSYHRERHTGFFALEKYAIKSPPHPDIAEEIARMPEAAELYGPFEYSDAFIEDYVARWKEIQKKYRPDFMWIDDIPIFYKIKPHPQTKKFRNAFLYMIADYFNAAERWGKEVYLNNKGANLNWPEGPGCLEKDNLKLETIGPKWENPATLGTSYGYMKAEEQRDAYKSPTELIHLLCDVVSKNGNLLLNIGPRADGIIPEGMQQRLLAIGKWLEVNGEAIYGTRPWTTFKQDKPDLRFTTKGNVLYAITLAKPTKPFVIQSTKNWKAGPFKKVQLLGSDKAIKWKHTQSGIHITPPRTWPGKHAWVFKIEKIANIIPDNLSLVALQTHARYIEAVNSGRQVPSDEISEKYWTDEIKRLNPIKVYMHRANIVVVQKVTNNRQEGLYINIVISSYLPRSGDDGFTFTDLGNSVYKFKRIIEN